MRTNKLFNDRVGYVLILPFYALFIYFILIPIVQVIWYSFTDFNLFTGATYTGLSNYAALLHDEIFLKSISNTLIYMVLTLFPTMAIGLAAALLLNVKFAFTGLARTLVFMPHIVSMVAVSMVWMWFYDPVDGLFNKIFSLLRMPSERWLLDPKLALGCVIVMGIWKGVGYNMLIFLAGLQGISKDYYEAAQVDGANRRVQFFRITLPLLAPSAFFLLVTGMISSFNVFDQVNVMTSGGPVNSTTTMVHQIYIRAFSEFKMGYASAEAVVLLAFILLVTLCNFLVTKSGGKVETH